MSSCITVADYGRAAREVLANFVLEYYRSGADAEHTLRDNESAYARIKLLPRVLRGVEQRSMMTTVLGTPIGVLMMVVLIVM